MKKYLITIIITSIFFLSTGLLIGRYHYPKKEIRIIEKKVYETQWKTEIKYIDNKPVFDQDNFNRLFNCYNSELKFRELTADNYLFITVMDDCKEASAKYQIGTVGNYKLYLTVGAVGLIAGGIITYKYFR
jgi:hypothetical protein